MGILDKLRSLVSPGGSAGGASQPERDANAFYFYIRCNNCGENVRIRADKRWDLSQEFDDNDRVSGYVMNKDVMGTRCFRMMYLHVAFDGSYRITKQTVENGTFIPRELYEQRLG